MCFRAPFVASLVATVVNGALDIFFMFGMGMGPAGAALATAVSQYTTFLILFRIMLKNGMLRVEDLMLNKKSMAYLPRLLLVCPSRGMFRLLCPWEQFVDRGRLSLPLGLDMPCTCLVILMHST
jgi:peptidoglycan biosynthesis protein MviN/MurJ (putative lipid II flippase)